MKENLQNGMTESHLHNAYYHQNSTCNVNVSSYVKQIVAKLIVIVNEQIKHSNEKKSP